MVNKEFWSNIDMETYIVKDVIQTCVCIPAYGYKSRNINKMNHDRDNMKWID